MTSTIAISQPVIALMRDGFGWTPKKAAIGVWSALFAFSIPTVLGNGYLDELDFWGATFALSVGALIEIILWAYVLGPRQALAEIRHGARIKIGGWFMVLIAVIAPVGLVTLLISWFFIDALPIWMMEGVDPAQVPWRWAARIVMFASFLLLGFIVAKMKIDHREPGGAS
jgi:SNF family Na+-dependent transporter